MTRGKLTDAATLEAISAGIGPGQRWAELCGPEGIDDGEPDNDHPGYGSLLGLGVRKPVKKPVIVLDPEVAEQAAQVMEINAGQLVVRGGQPSQGFGSLGLGSLGDEEEEPLEVFDEAAGPEPAYDDDDELDPAVAEWAARVLGNGDEDDVEEVVEESAEAVWPDEAEREDPPAVPEEGYELPAEPEQAWDEEPATEEAPVEEALVVEVPVEEPVAEEPIYEEPVHEEAMVEQAWLDWARRLIEPPAPAGKAPSFEEAEETAELYEPEEELTHPADEIALAEPELPKHELRQLLAQISHPRPTQQLWQRLLALLKRIFA